MERAEELFSMQGKDDPAYRRRTEKLVELLDLTTFEEWVGGRDCVGCGALSATSQAGGSVPGVDNGITHEEADNGIAAPREKVSARTRFKAVGNLIRQLGNVGERV